MADISSIKLPSGTTYTVKDSIARSHIGNKSNPHGVTAAQVGAAPAAHTHTSIESIQLTNQDLNDYMDNSVRFLYAPGGNTVKNAPSGCDTFGVYCYRSDWGYYSQELTDTSGRKYIRIFKNDVWSAWKEIVTSSNVAGYKVNNAGYADSAGNASKVNNHTVDANVPFGAKFTDTTYSIATQTANGLMSSDDKAKLDSLSATSVSAITNSEIDTIVAS